VRSLRDRYYPDSAWLRMPRATLDRLIEYQRCGRDCRPGTSRSQRLLDATDETSRITEHTR
jgi:hypothetical protein